MEDLGFELEDDLPVFGGARASPAKEQLQAEVGSFQDLEVATLPKSKPRISLTDDRSSFPRRTVDANFDFLEQPPSQRASPSNAEVVEFTLDKKIKDPEKMKQLLDRERGGREARAKENYDLPPPSAFLSKTGTLLAAPHSPDEGRFQSLPAHHGSAVYSATGLEDPFSERREILPFTNLTKPRQDYATLYGFRPEQMPYQDEVDLLHESDDRYQELNHWYFKQQKPTEENLDRIQQANHERLHSLSHSYKRLRNEHQQLHSFLHAPHPRFDEDFLAASVVQSKRRPTRPIEKLLQKEKYNEHFEAYLRLKRERELRGAGDFQYMVDFDRYECTSPDPKRVHKHHSLLYKENV